MMQWRCWGLRDDMREEEGETALWSNDDIIHFTWPGLYDLAPLIGVIVAQQVGKFKQSN